MDTQLQEETSLKMLMFIEFERKEKEDYKF